MFDHQFGFRSSYSTDLALTHLTDSLISSLNDGLISAGVFIDLSKAFDTIDHKIMLAKLHHYGIQGIALSWFEDYLSNRKQFTTCKQKDSSMKDITHGVPQGSILGPLLFLIYVNDLHHCSSKLSFTLFADDTTILFSHSDLPTLAEELNSELVKVSSWFSTNKLSLNSHKTKYMIFSKSKSTINDANISINHVPIERVHSTKFLGVVIDDKLSWTQHISHISKITSRNTGIMSKLRSFLPSVAMVSLYNTLSLPYLNYCNIVWACTSTSKLHSPMIIQKRAIRLATLSKPRDHTLPLFIKLHTLTLSDINKSQTGTFMYKYTHNLLPRLFTSYFTFNKDVHNHNTRSSNNMHVPFARTSYTSNTLRHYGPRLWNSVDQTIQTSSSVARFKISCKKFLISQYVTYFSL